MRLNELNNTIRDCALQHPLVNFCTEGDIYARYGGRDCRYPAIHLTVTNVSKQSSVWVYNYTIFYIDRLLADKSNKIQIQDAGVLVIQQILNKLKSSYDYFDFSNLSFTFWTEDDKLSDVCAGVYCTVQIQVEDNVGDCSDYLYVPQKDINLQDKTIDLSFAKQIICPDDGIDGLSSVTVPAISDYVNSDFSREGVILNKANKRLAYTGNAAEDAPGYYLTPYLLIYDFERGKKIQTTDFIYWPQLVTDLEQVTHTCARINVYSEQIKYDGTGKDLHPDIINYESYHNLCPIYVDYLNSVNFEIRDNVRWLRASIPMWITYPITIKIVDDAGYERILWQSNISTDDIINYKIQK